MIISQIDSTFKLMKMRLFLMAAIIAWAWANPAKAQEETKILWLGSSSTYCHDLPQQVSEWLNQEAGWNSRAYLVGKSGTGFHEYLRPGFEAQYGLEEGQTLLEKISEGSYDYVVLQQITYFMSEKDSAEIREATQRVCEAVREAGGKPVFYEMGWRLGPENETGRQMILAEAQKMGIEYYAPCSRAWKAVRAERPDLELHNLPDSDHPGTLGTYLNLCCFYAAMTGKSPVGLPGDIRYWPRFGAFDKEKAGEKLQTAQLDYYHAVMPDWMQKISIMGFSDQIDPKTAKYLQKMAWKTYKKLPLNRPKQN